MWKYLFCFMLCASPAFAGEVVVTIKPLHSLVTAVALGSDVKVGLLVDGKTSPHDFSLKPSQAVMLRNADIVFAMGDDFELFLRPLLPQLKERVAMEEAQGLTIYKVRVPGSSAPDLHLWLSVKNARAMTAYIAEALAKKYPAEAPLFQKNAKALDAKLAALDKNLSARMAPLKNKPFAVFHDATQYFDRAYGLSYIGAVALHAEQAPGAKHMQELRARISGLHASCMFAEPEFDARVVTNLVRGTGAKNATIDPEATQLDPGPELYFQLMENVADSFKSCLN